MQEVAVASGLGRPEEGRPLRKQDGLPGEEKHPRGESNTLAQLGEPKKTLGDPK